MTTRQKPPARPSSLLCWQCKRNVSVSTSLATPRLDTPADRVRHRPDAGPYWGVLCTCMAYTTHGRDPQQHLAPR